MITIKEITEEKDWHPEQILQNIPFQQSFWYGEMQKERGREVKRFIFSKDDEDIGCAQFVVYPLLGQMKYWYAAYGPIMKNADARIFKEIKIAVEDLARLSNPVFVRFDFSPALSDDLIRQSKNIFKKSSKASSEGSYFQPRHEWYTDVSKSTEEILGAMHQKTRYSVRYAEKKGVKTEIISGEHLLSHLSGFLRLMKDTARRNRFSLHDDGYYECFLKEIAKRDRGFLVEAKIGDEILASHFVVIEGKVAHYVFGASSDEQKELCAPYLAHFSGMVESKRLGASEYNFGGISEGGDAKHWQNITAFKKRFGGHTVSHSPYFDIVLRPFWYYLYVARKWVKAHI